MVKTTSLKDLYKFYNKRKGEDCSPIIHSYSNPQTTDRRNTQNKKIKLLSLVDENGSDGRFIVTDNVKLGGKCGENVSSDSDNCKGYLPAQLSVHDLLPEKQDGGKQLPSNGDVVIVTAHDSSVLGEMKVDLATERNPYNKINKKFQSIVLFPFCLFPFAIFCLPAMMYMRRSDKAHADQDFKEARLNGMISTICYVVGVLLGLGLYVFAFACIFAFILIK